MNLPDKETKLIGLNPAFAKRNQLPVFFLATKIRETEKAVMVNGKGTLEMKRKGVCFVCGRELTHPVSIKLGIGPVCGQHFWDWNLIGGYTEENKKVDSAILQIKLENKWIPKSCIKSVEDTTEVIENVQIPTLKQPKREKTAELKEGFIVISFPYNPDTVSKIKTLSNRKYKKEPKPHWICPATIFNVQKLDDLGFKIDEKISDLFEPIEMKEVPSHLKNTLFPFQKEGFEFAEKNQGRCLIGDEMGLGKTIQALTYLEAHPEVRPAIIITPASLKLNWKKECKMWMTDYNLFILSGRTPSSDLSQYQEVAVKGAGDIIIINYDILDAWVDALIKMKPSILIPDEIHFIKNKDTKRAKAVKVLSRKCDKFIGLSGTPIANRPLEFYNTLSIIDPNTFGNFWNYAKKFCGAKKGYFGWDFSGATNLEELHELTKNVMIRRLKEDVMKDLPPKIRSIVPIEITNKAAYDIAQAEVLHKIETLTKDKIKAINADGKMNPDQKAEARRKAMLTKNAEALMLMEKLKSITVQEKMPGVINWIEDHLESNGKLVVFATHTETLNILEEKFKDISVRIDGSTNMVDRDKAVTSFQENPEITLFLGNIKAAGVGLTLTAASATCFVELDWTPSSHDQAEDRVHRIGQEADSVFAYYLLANDTIENDIMELLDAKRKILDAVLDGKETEDKSLLSELMKRLIKGEKDE